MWRCSQTSVLLAVVVGLCGCERGCLSRWVADRGAERQAEPSLTLEGTDCSDGLLRCVGGRLEASRAAHVPHPCGAGKSGEARRAACECPWEVVARCPGACAMDGLEVVGGPSHETPLDGGRGSAEGGTRYAGAMQLCRPEVPVARPVLPSDPLPAEICTGRHVTCVDGIVRSCAEAGRITEAIAVCFHGCQWQVALDVTGAHPDDHGATANRDGAVSILCRHDQAERR